MFRKESNIPLWPAFGQTVLFSWFFVSNLQQQSYVEVRESMICFSKYFWLVVSNIFYFPFHDSCHPSHWRTRIFQDGYCTTNQISSMAVFLESHRSNLWPAYSNYCEPPSAPGHALLWFWDGPRSMQMVKKWHKCHMYFYNYNTKHMQISNQIQMQIQMQIQIQVQIQ